MKYWRRYPSLLATSITRSPGDNPSDRTDSRAKAFDCVSSESEYDEK